MVRDDQIRGYGQLLDWALERGVLPESQVDQLREEAAADPDARRRAPRPGLGVSPGPA